MAGFVILPKDQDALVDALDGMLSKAATERNLVSIEWFVAHYYLQGARRFRIHSWKDGVVGIPYENSQGELQFNYEGLTYQYRVELGRLARLAVGPAVDKEGFGLNSVRHAGMSQAVLSYMSSRSQVGGNRRIKGRLAQTLVKYGTGGLYHYRTFGDDFGDRTGIEVVPPWELLCIPAEVDTLEDVCGVARRRIVPLDWVRTLDLPDLPKRDESKLNVMELPYGESPNEYGPESYASQGASGYSTEGSNDARTTGERIAFTDGGKSRSGTRRSDARTMKWVVLDEIYTYANDFYLSERIVKVGSALGRRDTYYDPKQGYSEKIVCPLSICRYIDTGRFYGRGYVSTQLGLNYEVEKMLANQFQNVSDMDEFPMLVIPQGYGVSRKDVQKRERRKVVFSTPNPVDPKQRVESIAPATSGDFPAKIADMGIALQDKWSGHSEIHSGGAPGRTESAAALGFLHEAADINLVATVNNIGDAYVQMYASMLQAARTEADQSPPDSVFHLPLIDDRMVGVSLDASSGGISIDRNPIPHPWEVSIDIEERALRSKEQSKQEAVFLLQNGRITPVDFEILNELKGWGFPIRRRAYFENYRKAVIQKILLYNDGETPGYVMGGIEYDNPLIFLDVLGDLMASMEFSVASENVRRAFISLKSRYQSMLGEFPDDFPGLETMGASQQELPQVQAS